MGHMYPTLLGKGILFQVCPDNLVLTCPAFFPCSILVDPCPHVLSVLRPP